MPYAQVLELASIPGLRNVYQLGCYARRVTLYSQQVRAINLVDGIQRIRTSLKGKKIAVVGGGAGGVTAAARALAYEAAVTVIEKAPSLLSIQSSSKHRWLHPSLYDWPFAAVDVNEDKAELPVMDWSAGNANEVARALQQQFHKLQERNPQKLKLMASTEVTSVENEDSGKVRLRFGDVSSESFDLAILSVGFGLEPFNSIQNSYWEGDPIDNVARGNSSVLVVGYGDGALTDLMRACILDFDHERVLKQIILELSQDEKLGIVRSIEMHPRAREDSFLTERYPELEITRLRTYLDAIWNRNRKVVLAGPGPHLFSTRASALNRTVVSQLYHLGAFHHIAFDPADKINPRDEGDAVLKKLLTEVETAIGERPKHILLRFGPEWGIRGKMNAIPG